MAEIFDEHSEKAQDLMLYIEIFLSEQATKYKITFKSPYHDMSRRFLNEIIEFKPGEE